MGQMITKDQTITYSVVKYGDSTNIRCREVKYILKEMINKHIHKIKMKILWKAINDKAQPSRGTERRIDEEQRKTTYSNAGLGGSVGCAVRLETRRSRVQPPPRSATFFRGD